MNNAFLNRRARLLDAMAARGGGVAIQFTAPEVMRNRDSEYPFRADSQFHYLTGFPEPESALVLRVTGNGAQAQRESLLFCRERSEEREIWDGFRHGPEAAREAFGFDAAHPIAKLDELMPELLADAPALFCALGASAHLDEQVQRWLAAVRARARAGVRSPAALHDLQAIVDTMRLIKDDGEVDTMRRAAQISARAHVRAMQKCRPGWREYQLEAELLHEFRRRGAQAPAYNPIVAAGANACVLHYRAGATELRDGELCLIDAGCEVDGYAADVTRTFPANGRFSGPQRAVYDIVLAAQRAAIREVKPGASWIAAHDAATCVLTQGMIDLGLLTGSVEGLIESGAQRQFYMHRTGHWLGLDVHDVGDYRADGAAVPTADGKIERPWRTLQPGMALTVEPGLYIRPAANVPAQFNHIGIRIEDDVVVTAAGCEVLSCDAPKTPEEIEALMKR